MGPCCGCTLDLLHQKHLLFTAHNWSTSLQFHFAELLFFFFFFSKCIKSTKQLSFYDSVISVVIQALDDQVLRGGGVWVSLPKCNLLCIRTFISNNVCSCCRKLLSFWPVSVVKLSQHSPAMGLLPPIPCSWLFPWARWEVGETRGTNPAPSVIFQRPWGAHCASTSLGPGSVWSFRETCGSVWKTTWLIWAELGMPPGCHQLPVS